MHAWIKILLGLATTALITFAAHGWLGFGARYVDGLESRGRTALGNAGGAGIALRMEREPALRRIALLSGEADDTHRRALIAAIRAVPGIAGVRWEDVGLEASREAAAVVPAAASPEELK